MWEYMSLRIDLANEPGNKPDYLLTTYGHQGWELVSYSPTAGSGVDNWSDRWTAFCVMKRRVDQPTEKTT